MSFLELLDHHCDIYHLQEDSTASPGYGLPSSPSYSYPDTPDIEGQVCHFGVRSRSVTLEQTAPAQIMDAKLKLTLPAGTDVRMNDLIVDCDTGLKYTAEEPHNIRGHHIFVYIKKQSSQTQVGTDGYSQR